MTPIHSCSIPTPGAATSRRAMAFVLAASCAAFAAACNSSSSAPTPASADTTSTTTAASAASPAGSVAAVAAAPTSMLDHALSLISGGPFEGEIAMTITHDGKPPITNVFTVKGEKLRMNMTTGRGAGDYVIVDNATKQAIVVSDAKQTAMVMSLDGIAGAAAMMGAAKSRGAVHPVATGQTSVIAGYTCEIYKADDSNGDKDEACLAKGIRFPQMDPGANKWFAELGEGNYFPLRTVKVDATGKEKMRMEVTKIDKKSLPDSVFTPPLGYKTMSMEDMMKGHGIPPH